MECTIDQHHIKINVYDLLSNLSEDEFLQLMETAQWLQPAYIELRDSLRTEYATPTMSPELYRIRRAFFFMDKDEYTNSTDEDEIFMTMRSTMDAIIKENAELHVSMYNLQNAVGNVYQWLKDNVGDHRSYEMWKSYINDVYSNECRPYNKSRDMAKQIAFNDMVNDWVTAMIDRFNPEVKE